jgi:hypothetical protein
MPENQQRELRRTPGLTVKFAGQTFQLTTIALLLMLAGILIPTAKYAWDLREPTPAQLLVTVCMAMFSAVLFLWILDSTSILPFRSPWVARSVYGAAIVSILGTSVAVYRDVFAESKYPYDGLWEMTLWSGYPEVTRKHRVLLSYSSSAETYWGMRFLCHATAVPRPQPTNSSGSRSPSSVPSRSVSYLICTLDRTRLLSDSMTSRSGHTRSISRQQRKQRYPTTSTRSCLPVQSERLTNRWSEPVGRWLAHNTLTKSDRVKIIAASI